ncbi:putative oxidoreductase [anaerobic digester metagenome]
MNISYDYSGKNVLVTGAASGIGKETALMFARAGANVIVWDYNKDSGNLVADECKKIGSNSLFFQVDVSDEKSVFPAAEKVIEEYGHIDFLISNAGVGPRNETPLYGEGFLDDFRKILSVNVLGFSIVLMAFLKNFQERKQGKIVATSSVAYKVNSAILPHYAASKAAVSTLVRNAALMLGSYNINVNAICPGYVYTPIYHQADKLIKEKLPQMFADCETSEDIVKKMASASALHRIQTETDMANGILFLCSDEACNITGQDLNIDAGRTVM